MFKIELNERLLTALLAFAGIWALLQSNAVPPEQVENFLYGAFGMLAGRHFPGGGGSAGPTV